MIYVFLAEGFEESEAIIPIDILRRAGKDVVTVSISDSKAVTSSHGVTVMADTLFDENDYDGAELVVLPGGMPGAANLYDCEPLADILVERNRKGERIAAICAAPAVVLGQLGIIKGKRVACYPGFEDMLEGAEYTRELVETDGNITTAEGPAAAFPFGYELASLVASPEIASKIAEGMRFKHLMGE